MTIDEKIQLVHGRSIRNRGTQTSSRGAGSWIPGIPRLGIPELYFAGGSVGLSAGVGQATALPSSIANAATWDLKEAANYGQVIGSESSAYGINVNLGGDVNLTGREPRDGRTFETKGEDPMLAGKMTAAQLRAIRAQFVMAGIKHFSFNDQETGRLTADIHIDERSARETDLLAFEIAIKDSGVQSLMCAYNQVNDNWSCEDSYLLNQVLKGDWAFPGYVLSDFGATHSTITAANNGLDQEQPDNRYFGNLWEALILGLVHQSRLDDMVHRILRAMIADGLLDHPQTIQPIDVAADGAIAQEEEEQGAVLLKNNGVLPLSTRVPSIAVIGSHADVAVLSGGGSSAVDPVGGSPVPETAPCPPCSSAVVWVPTSPLKAIQAVAPGTVVKFDDGTNTSSAAALAASSSVAIVFVNQWSSEGMDLPSLNFTDLAEVTPLDQDALVRAVAAANPKTIVVMENGGPQVIPWAANVAAVLEAWYPGQFGGTAIANLLFGIVNPSGKLPMTFPASTNQLPRPVMDKPPSPKARFKIDYTIDRYNVGYKWFDAQGLTPAFPFGFGLSYTTFAISNPQLTATTSGTNQGFCVTFNLANTGSLDGAEVAQVYLLPPASTGEQRRLVGWQKTTLLHGQPQRVTIQVNASDASHPLAYWDTKAHAWTIPSGTYTVYLGNSSRNLTTVGTFEIP
jgi:beta-glucosidase